MPSKFVRRDDVWSVKAVNLRLGDEVRVRVMGGEEYLKVIEVEKMPGAVRIALDWGAHIDEEPFWDELDNDTPLTVRRIVNTCAEINVEELKIAQRDPERGKLK